MVALYVLCMTVPVVALSPLIGGWHWLLSGTAAGVAGYTAFALLLHFLRPWYRPIPDREQWTEDAL